MFGLFVFACISLWHKMCVYVHGLVLLSKMWTVRGPAVFEECEAYLMLNNNRYGYASGHVLYPSD